MQIEINGAQMGNERGVNIQNGIDEAQMGNERGVNIQNGIDEAQMGNERGIQFLFVQIQLRWGMRACG